MGKKSTAKANGLKSTFKLKDDVYFMTSFGKGNLAQHEKDIEGRYVKDHLHTFEAEVLDSDYASISGVAGAASVRLPQKDDNMLMAKSVIERMFFGATFEDNIHIQIAYNVMDIKKLLSVYANIIIHTVNNLLGLKYEDFVGTFPTMNDHRKSQIAEAIIKTGLINKEKSRGNSYFIKREVWDKEKYRSLQQLNRLVKKHGVPNLQNVSNCIVKQLGFSEYKYIEKTAKAYEQIKKLGLDKCAHYFSDVFSDSDGVNLNYVYEALRLLGNMRQTAFHSDDMLDESKRKENTYALFDIESRAGAETRTALNAITKNKLKALNDNFVKTSAVNLNILFSAYPDADKKELIKKYYDFSVRKAFKNMGFSVKKLRELLFAEEASLQSLNDKSYDSVRSKLYSLIDFVIYEHYSGNDAEADEFVKKLRGLILTNDEEEKGTTLDDMKLETYKEQAEALWGKINETVLGKIIPGIDKCRSSTEIKALRRIDKALENEIRETVENAEDLSYFSKAMYCICAFLDAKEINMFLDSMINSFDNIVSLIKAAEYTERSITFTDNYSFFNNCSEKADELRFIKSIARMNKGKKAVKNSEVSVKSFQYYEAAAILGENNRDKINDMFRLNEKSTKEHKVDHTLRNFFINNVINSNRFSYVIRFVDPVRARMIMENEALVSYAISDIDDKQIIRYCESTEIAYTAKEPDLAKMRQDLVEKIMQIKFDTFAKVSNDPKEAVEKEKLKALVGLYLTIVYLITKALVRINTSYSIAFGVFERDCEIMRQKAKNEDDPELRNMIKNVSVKNNPMGITEYFEIKLGPDKFVENENKKHNGRARVKGLIERNKMHYNDSTFKEFRNNVEHLSVVSRLPDYLKPDLSKDLNEIYNVHSYFDLYHYIMLRILNEGGKIYSKETEAGLEKAFRKQSAYKDFLYGILAPFAYNPARYINLASQKRFTESYERKKSKKEKEK